MTQEQDIVERLQDRAKFYDDSADCPVYFEHDKFLDIEAAQTIAALRAERDRCRDRSVVVMIGDTGHYVSQAVADQLAALRAERDEARKALEPFAKAADDLDDQDEDRYELWEHPSAMNITVGDLRRARIASSNREGGEE